MACQKVVVPALLTVLCQDDLTFLPLHDAARAYGHHQTSLSNRLPELDAQTRSGVVCFARIYTALTAYAVLMQQSLDATQTDIELLSGYT